VRRNDSDLTQRRKGAKECGADGKGTFTRRRRGAEFTRNWIFRSHQCNLRKRWNPPTRALRASRDPVKAFIALGSNVGDRAHYLSRATDAFIARGIKIVQNSGTLDNAPILYLDQARFLNSVLEIDTDDSPEELLAKAKQIELDLGRVERFRFGPREIDIDIIAFAGQRRSSDALTLPHPGLFDRPYLRELLARLGQTPEQIAEL